MANNFNSLNGARDITIYSPATAGTPTAYLKFYQTYNAGAGHVLKILPVPDGGTIAGPCRIRLSDPVNNDPSKYCSYKITRPDVVVEASP
jgi:hypothetical protein